MVNVSVLDLVEIELAEGDIEVSEDWLFFDYSTHIAVQIPSGCSEIIGIYSMRKSGLLTN